MVQPLAGVALLALKFHEPLFKIYSRIDSPRNRPHEARFLPAVCRTAGRASVPQRNRVGGGGVSVGRSDPNVVREIALSRYLVRQAATFSRVVPAVGGAGGGDAADRRCVLRVPMLPADRPLRTRPVERERGTGRGAAARVLLDV